MSVRGIEVVVLTQPDCHYCEHATQVLTRVGRDYPLLITHIRLDSPRGVALAAHHGVLFAPGILLGGDMFGYGRLSERRLRRHLDRVDSDRPQAPGPASPPPASADGDQEPAR